MYILDSGFTIFRPNTNADVINPTEDSIMKRLTTTEQFIISLQDRIRFLENEHSQSSFLDSSYLQVHDDKIERFLAPKIMNDIDEPEKNDSVASKVVVTISSSFTRIYEHYVFGRRWKCCIEI
jgi:predicted nucleotidyltransferase